MDTINSPRNHSNPESPRSINEYRKVQDRKVKILGKLPSPRELQQVYDDEDDEEDSYAVPQKRLVSISELNPIFEELDYSSTTSSTTDEVVELYRKDTGFLPNAEETMDLSQTRENESPEGSKPDVKCKRTSSIRQIWSSLGSTTLPGLPVASGVKSQDSITSSSDLSDGKKTLRNRLKRVSSKVRKQFSATGGFIADRLSGGSLRRESNTEADIPTEEMLDHDGSGDNTSRRRKPKRSSSKNTCSCSCSDFGTPCSCPSLDNVNRMIDADEGEDLSRPIVQLECFGKKEKERKECLGLIWNLPNWMNPCTSSSEAVSSLEEVIEEEKQRLAQKQPMEWAEAIEYLRRSVGKDFRRGYLALGEKMQLPNLQAIRCLKFSPFHSFLAIGCEEGTLLILELDFHKPLQCLRCSGSTDTLQSSVPNASALGTCRIRMNETLVGHAYDLRCLAWNNSNGKLITSDEIGVIIGWGVNDDACWVEEIINDRSTSMIRDMAWSPNGKKIVIGYEDYGENGCVTGGIIVAHHEGMQIYDRKFPDSQVNFVVWYDDSVIWAVLNQTLYSFDMNGELGKVCRPLAMSYSGERNDLMSFLLKPKTSWITSERAPDFAVVYRGSCMSLHSSISDQSPVRVHTQITATCADWSANGLYIVIGGMSIAPMGSVASPQVNLFNYEGKLLQILKIPEQMITSVSWDPKSFHLTISTERHIYFANLRPMYKVSSTNKANCYAYTKDCVNQLITFWNYPATLFTEKLPGKVIDIKSCCEKFAVLLMDSSGVYHVLVFGETGVFQKELCVITMEPFALTMTKNCIVCLAPNAILNWNYNLGDANDTTKKFTAALKPTRQVHIDDFPTIIAKPGEKAEHLNKPVLDCARCMHAMRDQLCVAKESGKLQFYALPTLGFLQAYLFDLDGDICQQIMFNSDGTRLALLTMNGWLRICIFPQKSGDKIDIIYCEVLTSISGMLWATDLPNHISVLEGNNLHILEDGKLVEGVSQIPSGCYLSNFEDLMITLIHMDRVIENPDRPHPTMVLQLPTPSYSKILDGIEQDDPIEEVLLLMNSLPYRHPLMRKVIGNEALKQGNYVIAEGIFIEERNYAGLRFMEKLSEVEGTEIKRAYTYSFLGEHDQAQLHFIRAGRKDLAVKMWKDLGSWERVTFLTGHNAEDFTADALESQYEICCAANDWDNAVVLANKLESPEKVIESCVMRDDHEGLILLAERLPVYDPVLVDIGRILGGVGLVDDAVQCFLKCGDPMMAMKVAMDTRNWDLAMKLSSMHNLPFIQPALVKHVRSLIDSNRLNPAIQVLERCGKVITAGKLLVWKGLRMLEVSGDKLLDIKKTFVLAARMLSKKNRVKRSQFLPGTSGPSKASIDGEELDLEYLIPSDHLKIMSGHNEWCWSDPWRGAEALHYLMLTQHFVYSGMMERSFRAAMHLKHFEDILGAERVNSLVALTAINSGYLNVASNALLKLEAEDAQYSSIAFDLFREHPPRDRDANRVACPECRKNIPDYSSVCPFCKAKFIVCLYSASLISSPEMWTCQTCSRHVDYTKRDRFEYCLLCHSESDRT